MQKERICETIKEILEKSGMEELISISENTNELADIMIYQKPEGEEAFALNGIPQFPITAIENILYRYGEEKMYNYVGTSLQLMIELEGDIRYILEFGDGGVCEVIYYDGEWVTENDKIKESLEKYNRSYEERIFFQDLVYLIAKSIEENEDVDESVVREVCADVNRYIEKKPTDIDFLFSLTRVALQIYTFEDKDLFDVKNLIKRVIGIGYEDKFLNYMKEYDGFVGSYYLTLIATTLQMIRDVR